MSRVNSFIHPDLKCVCRRDGASPCGDIWEYTLVLKNILKYSIFNIYSIMANKYIYIFCLYMEYFWDLTVPVGLVGVCDTYPCTNTNCPSGCGSLYFCSEFWEFAGFPILNSFNPIGSLQTLLRWDSTWVTITLCWQSLNSISCLQCKGFYFFPLFG